MSSRLPQNGSAVSRSAAAKSPAKAARAAKPARAASAAKTTGAAGAAGPGVTLVPIAPLRARLAVVIKSRRSPAVKRKVWTIKHNGRRYAVFDSGGQLEVTDARCPHNGGPLTGGVVRDGAVICPWHLYCFDLRTGECRTAAGYRLRKYPVLSRDGRLFAQLPGVARPRAWSRLLQVRRSARKPAPD
jgi:nitrite reductase/ring-hydroxylating ferredoxin subunit